ncbi:hypothetical protein [Paraburkholderia panacisoli]|uniref:hypothetical protein n=1 Tax=Paraburkholderia panacisoli TaxID=2603818 RepID=UPI00165F4B9F|nr:hypothetical protein [Paraburkholderia panacisoli]
MKETGHHRATDIETKVKMIAQGSLADLTRLANRDSHHSPTCFANWNRSFRASAAAGVDNSGGGNVGRTRRDRSALQDLGCDAVITAATTALNSLVGGNAWVKVSVAVAGVLLKAICKVYSIGDSTADPVDMNPPMGSEGDPGDAPPDTDGGDLSDGGAGTGDDDPGFSPLPHFMTVGDGI